MTRNPIALAALCGTLALAACSGKSDTPAAQRTSVATAAAGSLTVELLTDTRLETGRTPIYLRVKDAAGQAVTNATVTFMPMMVMPTMSHSAPMLGAPVLEADGAFWCDVVFQMAGSWSATATIALPGAEPVEAQFTSLEITDSGRAKTFTYTDPTTGESTKYVASLNVDAAAKVGLNPVTVTLHRRADMMTFPPVDDATIVLDPQMPSMGHGSPGSVNPTLAAPGTYEGQLSFSMPGDWETTVTFTRGGVTIGAPKFPFTF
jgi:hypothetical protein